MNRRHIGLGALPFLLLFAVEPVAAQSVTGDLISELNNKLLYVAFPIAVFVEGILIYTVWKFRNNDDPKPTEENRRLEITWTIATAVILLFVGVAAYQVMASPYVTLTRDEGGAAAELGSGPDQPGPEPMNLSTDNPGAITPSEANAAQVEIVAFQWGWEFHYPNGKMTSSELVVPTNRPVYLHITSTDVIHAVHIPTLGLKQDAVPGQYNTLLTEVTEPGEYQLYCAEYCGAAHSQMLATVRAVPPGEYQQFLQEGSGGNGAGTAGNNSTSGASATNSSSVQGTIVPPAYS